jgi:Na+-transporting NADH:ubiquinone oxidoreductase subunit NqrF
MTVKWWFRPARVFSIPLQKSDLPAVGCGGGGTCGMCKCQVVEGGGSILPTETGFFTRKEQLNDWRTWLQVKVRENNDN